MADRRKMPTETAIRRYWADDALWANMGVEPPADVDVKGVCMACGLKAGTQRSHIDARANRGPDTVDNLHMLCGHCHHASELLEGKAYWRWLGRQNVFTVSLPSVFARCGMSLENLRLLTDEQVAQFERLFAEARARRVSLHDAIDQIEDAGIDIRL
jgi:HNH endonuclease